MPQPAALHVGGYYALPAHLAAPIASLIDPAPALNVVDAERRTVAIVDPCAADGAAVLALTHALLGPDLHPMNRRRRPKVQLCTCELEAERAAALRRAMGSAAGHEAETLALHGDAFRVAWSRETPCGERWRGSHLLYLNPPYLNERRGRRVEVAFLERFTPLLLPGGVLVLVVQGRTLDACAELLAGQYDAVWCYRFPDADYAAFTQVVLIARRADAPLDPALASAAPVLAQVRAWAADPESLPMLGPSLFPVVALPSVADAGVADWRLMPLDVMAVRAGARPGMFTTPRGALAPAAVLGLDRGMADLVGRTYPVAMPLTPAHTALALAAGIFNGRRIRPDDPASGLPDLLVKGMFRRELHSVTPQESGDEPPPVMVEQPQLTLRVLDLSSGRYHTLAAGSQPSGAPQVAAMNIADLLARYGDDLLRVMTAQCPPLHDPRRPEHAIPLPPLARPPLRAQAPRIMAALKLLARGDNPFVLGEVGTGKSLIALACAWALHPRHYATTTGAITALGLPIDHAPHPVRRVLVLTEPHLLDSWREQARLTLPGAQVVVLESLDALDRPPPGPRIRVGPGVGLTIFVLSKERNKLGHGYAGGLSEDRRCPRCGARHTISDADAIRQRGTCGARRWRPSDEAARLAEALADALALIAPASTPVGLLLSGAVLRRAAAKLHGADRAAVQAARETGDNADRRLQELAEARWQARAGRPVFGVVRERLQAAVLALLPTMARSTLRLRWLAALRWLIVAIPSAAERDDALAAAARALLAASRATTGEGEWRSELREAGRSLLLLISDPARRDALARRHRPGRDAVQGEGWRRYDAVLARLARECEAAARVAAGGDSAADAARRLVQHARSSSEVSDASPAAIELTSGRLCWERVPLGSVSAAVSAAEELRKAGTWEHGPVCGEPLYGAAPSPRRFPVAEFVARYRRDAFQLLILDEAQDYRRDDSAQTRAAHRLALLGIPTLLCTGSASNGKASSLYESLWIFIRAFREAFGRRDRAAFVTRYGYRKVLVERDETEGKVLGFGAVSDRVERDSLAEVRTIGEAPGVLPALLLDWLLPVAVPIRKADLDQELPPLREIPAPIRVAEDDADGQELLKRARTLTTRVMQQIRDDRGERKRSGILFGAFGQVPSYLDRCTADTGNAADANGVRAWETCYPARVGGGLVAAAPLFPAAWRTPKERWLLAKVRAELAEGRRCLVFVWHSSRASGLITRLQRLFAEDVGEMAALLDADRVPARKRQAWITDEVIAAGRRVLIVNPLSVGTGLNNLVSFATGILYQTPNDDAIIYRQAIGRLHRIGQEQEVRIFVPYYAGTAQEAERDLLGRKIAASVQVDGVDVTSALDAAGAAGRSGADALSFGEALYRRLIAAPERVSSGIA